MVEKIEDGKLAIKGRIDSNNANTFEEELLPLCPVGKLKKTIKAEVTIENVSSDIYDIFSVTGFTQIMKVMKALRQINVDGCEVIGEGANGKVYRLDDETIIKVFAPGVPLKVVQEERDIARAAFVSGVPTAISYDIAKVGDSYGAVYEMLHAKTLSAFINENPERAEEMGRRMGELLKELHHTPASKDKLPNMLDVYKERVVKMEKYLSKEELSKLMKVYDVLEERSTMLHGDYHPKNVMYMNDELIFIDMGDVGYGHPLLDLGSSYLGMVHVGKMNPAMVPKYIGLDFEAVTKVWDNMLLAYFGKDNIEEARKLAEIYGEAKYMLTPLVYTKMTEEMAQGLIARTRQNGFVSNGFDIAPALSSSIEF